MKIEQCQLCNGTNLVPVLDLGAHPPADRFLYEKELSSPPEAHPLVVGLCETCGHLMLLYRVPATERYQAFDYSYTASNSQASVKHFNEFARETVEKHGLDANDLVVDIGSNDGTLLLAFRDQTGCSIIGIDPASNIVKLAHERGVETIEDFFGPYAVEQILARGRKSTVITATNAFNHVDDLQTFVGSVESLLTPDGAFVFEVPYKPYMLKEKAFDTIYHEHVSYFTVGAFAPFFKKFGLYITDLVRIPYMGASVRVTVSRSDSHPELVRTLINEENEMQVREPKRYAEFMDEIRKLKERVIAELVAVKKQGGKVVGIGAAAKGNTLLTFCGIDGNLLEFVTDSSPLKIGKYTPGTLLPIKPDQAVTEEITHALILPWNIADLLTKKLARPGLSFITPHF